MLIAETEECVGGVDRSNDSCLNDFIKSSEQVLRERGLGSEFGLQVFRHGCWFFIGGRVDSHQTKSIIFALVPELDGARWIVDRLHVGSRKGVINGSKDHLDS